MAVRVDSSHQAEPAEAEVTSCVANLIQAFTNGLNIFKRLRERRKKKKARQKHQVADPTTSAELQLSKSLKKGPQELAERYAECYHGGMGHQFAKGDSIAHASLAETLIKLNTGLVGIIATFLNHDHKSGKSHLDLDYKSLTNLSDISRKEALQSMTQLYQRLSQSQLQLYTIGAFPCAKCGSSKHSDCSKRSSTPEKDTKKSRTSASSSRQRSSGPIVTKMPIKSSSQPQLVVVRPKASRKGSSSSNNSNSNSSSKSSSSSSGYSSPAPSPPPLPKYVPIDPLDLYMPGTFNPPPVPTLLPAPEPYNNHRRRIDSVTADSRPPTWSSQQTYKYNYPDLGTAPTHLHHPKPKLPDFTPVAPRRASPPQQQQHLSSSSHRSTNSSSSNKTSPPLTPAPAISPFTKRRLDKATPSSYIFASDSTKLGEIPQRAWTQPWDYEEAARLNAEAAAAAAAAAAVASTAPAVGEKGTSERSGRKKGVFKFLRRGSMQA